MTRATFFDAFLLYFLAMTAPYDNRCRGSAAARTVPTAGAGRPARASRVLHGALDRARLSGNHNHNKRGPVMVKLIRSIVLAALCALGGVAHAAGIDGTWTASFETQVGQQTYTYTFKADGMTLTGTAKGNLITDSVLSDGKIDGNKIVFVEKGNYMGMPLTFNYTGELVGDEIRFKRELMGFPAEELVAKRSN
jgi:hypothetical protein